MYQRGLNFHKITNQQLESDRNKTPMPDEFLNLFIIKLQRIILHKGVTNMLSQSIIKICR